MTIDSLFDVKSEIVVITGVSGKLGNEYANTFLARGSCVVGLDIRPPAVSHDLKKIFFQIYLLLSGCHIKDSLKRVLAVTFLTRHNLI